MLTDVIIELDAIYKTYQSGTGPIGALEDITLSVGQGEFLSVVGPSGCGKSTLLKIIAGLVPASAGRVNVLGKPVQGPYPDYGIVFQHPVLLGWRTVLDNVLLQVEVRRLQKASFVQSAREILSFAGLDGFENKYPNELSGGMQQRVSICRALIHNPSILLMDEPFGALDAMTREAMNQEIQRIWLTQKKTVVFVTHSIAEAVFLSDRVVVMSPRPGRIEGVYEIDLGRPRDLDLTASSAFGAHVSRIRRAIGSRAAVD